MPASNSFNYANWVEIKVVGGGKNVLIKNWRASERHCSPTRLTTLPRLLTQTEIFHTMKERSFNNVGDQGPGINVDLLCLVQAKDENTLWAWRGGHGTPKRITLNWSHETLANKDPAHMLIILTGPHKVKKFHVLWDSLRALAWECSSRGKLRQRSSSRQTCTSTLWA